MTGYGLRGIGPDSAVRPKTILAVARPGEAEDGLVAFAAGLAKRLDFALDFVESYDNPPVGIADCYAIGSVADAHVLDRHGAIIDGAIAPARACFDAAIARNRIAGKWTSLSDALLPAEAARHAREADFVLLRRPGGRLHLAQSFAERLLLSGGIPILILPAQVRHGAFRKILCAWDGSPQAGRALRASLPLLRQASKVRLIRIGGALASRSATASLDKVVAELASEGIEADGSYLARGNRSIAATLLDYCERFRCEMLVMGAYRRLRVSELVLGGVTRTLLENSTVSVFMAH